MNDQMPMKILEVYERGGLSRRQAVARLLGLGAAMALAEGSGRAAEGRAAEKAMFQATGLDHVALDVTDVARSRDFYARHLGLNAIREGERMCFMAPDDGEFILALFQAEEPGLNHYCYEFVDYDFDAAVAQLKRAGLERRREANRVYFKDPDGITVQIAAR